MEAITAALSRVDGAKTYGLAAIIGVMALVMGLSGNMEVVESVFGVLLSGVIACLRHGVGKSNPEVIEIDANELADKLTERLFETDDFEDVTGE